MSAGSRAATPETGVGACRYVLPSPGNVHKISIH
jgi:hypothetical protein